MYELSQIIPVNVLLSLEPEELGAKLLFLLRKREFMNNTFHPSNLRGELWTRVRIPGHSSPYPENRRDEIDVALAEAWAWLEAQGLVIPAIDANGSNGWRIFSRRAKRFESEAEFAQYALARVLPKEILDPRIANKVWMAFMRGEFDVAAFQAMKAVEVSVREAANLENRLVGVALMREAFAPERGKLTEANAEKGEQVACMDLFAGAIGLYKNPHSHRDVNLDDPIEAMEIILLANRLLRIVASRVT